MYYEFRMSQHCSIIYKFNIDKYSVDEIYNHSMNCSRIYKEYQYDILIKENKKLKEDMEKIKMDNNKLRIENELHFMNASKMEERKEHFFSLQN